jgi:hypothetical protein
MAIEFVGSKSADLSATGGANVNIPLNSGLTGGIGSAVQAGDLVIVSAMQGHSTTVTLSVTDPSAAAYTLIGSQLNINDTTDANLRMTYKFMGGTPDASVNVSSSISYTTSSGGAIVYVFRGVDTTTPLDVAAVTATAIDSGLVNPPAITPVTSGAVVVVAGCAGHALTVPVGATGLSGVQLQTNTTGTWRSSNAMGYSTWTSGSLDPAAWTLTGSSVTCSWAAITIALRPGVGGRIKFWNGAAWTAKPVKFWNGSAWVTKPLKRWNGSAWVATSY